MALVFKIKFEDTLRRWVVCESWDHTSMLITIQGLEVKIRELFHISSTSPLVITYVDKEDDVVTLTDQQELLDACLVQRLNPLRVDVKLREKAPEVFSRPPITPPEDVQDGNAEAFLKAFFPQSTSDAIKQFLSKYPHMVDMKMPAAELMRNVQLLKNLSGQEALPWRDGSQATPTSYENAAHSHLQLPCVIDPALCALSKSNCGKVASTRIFHRGVQCDGCGMIPIEGPRFKSMKMYDYDLCSACFEAIGNDTDFQRLDLPVYPVSHGFYHPSCPARWSRQHVGASVLMPSFSRGPYGWMPACPSRVQRSSYCPSSEAGRKLDARFVKDVTIFDGTEVAPCTEFTKIWRLRNVGTIPWPQKTQLVRIGGDMNSEEVVNLELPEGGLPCGADVDICVDLVAPEKVGRYVSHWRLMSPAGHKFGHRVWVVIQVVPQNVESLQLQPQNVECLQLQESLIRGEETSDGEEETVTLETENTKNGLMSGSGKGKEILISALSKDTMVSPSEQPRSSDSDEEKEKLFPDPQKVEDILTLENGDPDQFNRTFVEEQNTVKTNSAKEPDFVVDTEILVPREQEQDENVGSSVIDSEVDGFSVVGRPTENVGYDRSQQGAPEGMQMVLLQEQSTESVVLESIKTNQEMQLQLLQSMGFMDPDVNLDLLEKNNQDLDLTLDDLVAVARWDNMLKDLQEMGFSDKLMNCRLLLKNQGSMKRAVKDLVEMEKQKAGWQEMVGI